MKYKPPLADAPEYATLEHLPDNYKADVEEWIAEHKEDLNTSYFTRNWSEDKKEGYEIALRHLHHAMQVREWI